MNQIEIIFLLLGLLLGLAFYAHRKIVVLTTQISDLNKNHTSMVNYVADLTLRHNLLCLDTTKSNTAIIEAHNELVNHHNSLVVAITGVGGSNNNNQKRLPGDEWKDGGDSRLGDYFSDN